MEGPRKSGALSGLLGRQMAVFPQKGNSGKEIQKGNSGKENRVGEGISLLQKIPLPGNFQPF